MQRRTSLALLIALLSLVLAACGGSAAPTSAPISAAAPTAKPTTAPKPTDAPKPKPTAKPAAPKPTAKPAAPKPTATDNSTAPRVAIGETATAGNLTLVVNEVDEGENADIPAADGNGYFVVDMTVQNNGSEAVVFSTLVDFTLYDEAGNKYDESLFAVADSTAQIGSDLPAGGTLNGKFGFEVPLAVESLVLVYDDFFGSVAQFQVLGDGGIVPATSADNADPSTGTSVAVTIDGTEKYEHSTGVFQISAPKDWTPSENNTDNNVATFWQSPEGFGVMIVAVQADSANKLDDLPATLTEFLNTTFEAQNNLVIEEAVAQSDGSDYIAFTFDETETGASISGDAFVQRNGDYVSFLVMLVPLDQFDALQPQINEILNSYSVDETVTIK